MEQCNVRKDINVEEAEQEMAVDAKMGQVRKAIVELVEELSRDQF